MTISRTRIGSVLGSVAASFAMAGTALAQTANPITNADVIGNWNLLITPAERQGVEIRVEMDQGDLPLSITGQTSGPLTCVMRDAPAPCRIQRGDLVVTMPTRSGGGRMIFTMTDRTRGGFSGSARVSVRFLPINGHIGSVAMTRR